MNRLLIRRLLVAVSSLSMLGTTLQPRAEEFECCPGPGTVLAFFNGVLNTESAAQDTLDALHKIHGELDGSRQKIQYELMYNYTKGFDDFVETFEQRKQEQNGVLDQRWEFFLTTLGGSDDGRWWASMSRAFGSPLKDLSSSIVETFSARMVGTLLSLFSSPPTELNYAKHRARIDSFIAEGKKLLFVSHSQGNLFVVPAYDYAFNKTSPGAVRVVHIAPASPMLRGAHILADLDLVINGLRPTGAVVSVTHQIPSYSSRPPGENGKRDPLGHGMIEIYINQRIEISKAVKGAISTALAELISLLSSRGAPSESFGAWLRLCPFLYDPSRCGVYCRRAIGQSETITTSHFSFQPEQEET